MAPVIAPVIDSASKPMGELASGSVFNELVPESGPSGPSDLIEASGRSVDLGETMKSEPDLTLWSAESASSSFSDFLSQDAGESVVSVGSKWKLGLLCAAPVEAVDVGPEKLEVEKASARAENGE